jgi:hypothetical protein
MISRGEYLRLIANLSLRFGAKFPDVWYGSLLHEKNTNKSRAPHILLKGLAAESHKFSLLKALILAIRKYLALIYLRLSFGKAKLKQANRYYFLVFDYGKAHLKFFLKEEHDRCGHIIFPQKDAMYEAHNECRRRQNSFCVYSFLRLQDFLCIPFLYIATVFRYIANRKELFGVLDERYPNADKILKHDAHRSFLGDVAIESLAYSAIFKNINAQSRGIYTHSIFVYEGLNWEKALCKYMDTSNIAVVCSASPDNYLSFFYHNGDTHPRADRYCVMGKTQLKQFSKYFGNTVIYGSGRYQYLHAKAKTTNYKNCKTELLVVLGYNKDEAQKLLHFVEDSGIAPHLVKIKRHPLNKIQSRYDAVVGKLGDLLNEYKYIVLTGDTSVMLEALHARCDVFYISLPDYADMCVSKAAYVLRKPHDLKMMYETSQQRGWLSNIFFLDRKSSEVVGNYFANIPAHQSIRRILYGSSDD